MPWRRADHLEDPLAEKWRDVVKKMVEKGAVLSDEEFKAVVDYLYRTSGRHPQTESTPALIQQWQLGCFLLLQEAGS